MTQQFLAIKALENEKSDPDTISRLRTRDVRKMTDDEIVKLANSDL